MKLTSRVKYLIRKEYAAFEESMYAGKTKNERDKLAQFFTPPEITFLLLKNYTIDSLADKVIRDPCCGSGNLLAAAIIAGADPDKVFGNDYDARMVKACRDRIRTIPYRLQDVDPQSAAALAVKLQDFKDWQIHRGDALDGFCLTEFGPDYKQKLEQHYLDEQGSMFPMLTPVQEEFLKEVD